jgi:hypothetical protein
LRAAKVQILAVIDKLLQILPLRTSGWLNNRGAGLIGPFLLVMKLSLLVLSLSMLSSAAWAQPERGPLGSASRPVSEQRRAELRDTLKTQPGSEQGKRQQEAVGSLSGRRLSDQERADLRQQLRQQRPETRPQRP